MNYLILIVFVFIIIIITHVHFNNKNNAYIIERYGSFNRIETKKMFFCMPLLDKIKCAISLDSQEKECHFNSVISSDGKVIITSSIIYYHIVEPFEAVYETENLEKTLEDVQIKTFREFCDKLDTYKIKNIDETMKLDYKNLLNNQVKKYGCQIDNVKIKTWDDNALNNKFNEDLKRIDDIKKKIETSNFKTTNETTSQEVVATFVGGIVGLAVLLISAIIIVEIRKRFKLTFIFFRTILNNLAVFFCSSRNSFDYKSFCKT